MTKRTREHTLWAVLRTQGYGEIVATAWDRANAKLRTAILYSNDYRVDYALWWAENAKRNHLVLTQITVRVPAYKSTPHNGWQSNKPPEDRCEWDTGGLLECQCENSWSVVVQGRRLCKTHRRKAERDGVLRLLTPNAKVSGAGTASAGLPGYTDGG